MSYYTGLTRFPDLWLHPQHLLLRTLSWWLPGTLVTLSYLTLSRTLPSSPLFPSLHGQWQPGSTIPAKVTQREAAGPGWSPGHLRTMSCPGHHTASGAAGPPGHRAWPSHQVLAQTTQHPAPRCAQAQDACCARPAWALTQAMGMLTTRRQTRPVNQPRSQGQPASKPVPKGFFFSKAQCRLL